MNILNKIFKVEKKVNWGGTIAQILLVMIILPIVVLVISAISTSTGADESAGESAIQKLFISGLSRIPICDTWVELLKQFFDQKKELSAGNVSAMSISVFLKAFPEALMTGFVVFFTDKIADNIGMHGIKIIPPFAAVAFTGIILAVIGISKSDMVQILIEYGVVIVMMIGFHYLLKTFFPNLSIAKNLLIFFIDALYAVILTAYITILALTCAGMFSTVRYSFLAIFSTGLCVVIASGIEYLLIKSKKEDKQLFNN